MIPGPEGEENKTIKAKMDRAVEQKALAGMVAVEAANDTRDGMSVRLLSP